MDHLKVQWRKGFNWFCVLLLSIIVTFTTPDGTSIFVGFLGLFGIPPSFPVGANSRLYLWGIPHLALIIASFTFTRRYWRGYRTKFTEIKYIFYALPTIMVVALLIATQFTPSPIDRLYFSVMARQEGFNAMVYSSTCHFDHRMSSISWHTTSQGVEYTYTFTVHSFRDNLPPIQIILVTEWGEEIPVLAPDSNMPMTFHSTPRHSFTFSDSFTVPPNHERPSSGWSRVSVIITEEDGTRHYPRHLERLPPW